jgi:hypothetical protein
LLSLPAVGDNAAMKAEPKRKRRWFQFSLRSLMIVATLLAIPCAYVSWQAEIAKRRMAMYQQFFSYSMEITRIGMICESWSPILNGEAASRIQTGTVPRVVVSSISGLAADRDRPSAFRKWLGEITARRLADLLRLPRSLQSWDFEEWSAMMASMSITRPNETLLLLSPFLAGIGGAFAGIVMSVVWPDHLAIAIGAGVIVSWLALVAIAIKTGGK